MEQTYLKVRDEDLVLALEEVLARVEPFMEHRLDDGQITRVAIGSVAAPNTVFKGESRSPMGQWTRPTCHLMNSRPLESLIGDSLERNGSNKAAAEHEMFRFNNRIHLTKKGDPCGSPEISAC